MNTKEYQVQGKSSYTYKKFTFVVNPSEVNCAFVLSVWEVAPFWDCVVC